jgi:hypothetical protein
MREAAYGVREAYCPPNGLINALTLSIPPVGLIIHRGSKEVRPRDFNSSVKTLRYG